MMSQSRRQLDKKSRKNIQKHVKSSQIQPEKEEILRSDQLDPKKALAKYPKKRQKSTKPLIEATIKGMEIKKKKKQTKTSKRTTPGDVHHRESPPANEHREGARSKKNLTKQSLRKRKSITSKLQKRNNQR